MELVEDAQAPAADDPDEGVDARRLQPLEQQVGEISLLDHLVGVHAADVERVHARRLAEDARAVRVEVGDEPGVERDQPAVRVALRVQ